MSRIAHQPRALLALTLTATALALVGFAPTAIAAEGERVLDPALSLTGACKAEELDPVEDPGCPYPAFPAGPSGAFANPRAVATDDYGNIYVASFGSAVNGSNGRIYIFDPQGQFISEVKVEGVSQTLGPTSMAIDSKGYLYVVAQRENDAPLAGPIMRLTPDAPYEPEAGNISYSSAPVTLADSLEGNFYNGLAINRDDDHLFANWGGGGAREYASAEEGNAEIRSTSLAPGTWGGNVGMAIDAMRDRMYASAGAAEERIDIFDLGSVTPEDEYEKIGSILDSSVPDKSFGTQLSIAVNEGNGHVFVLDGENTRLYEFNGDGEYLTTIEFPFRRVEAGEIGVDNGPFSPNGKLGEEEGESRYLFVPSHRTGTGHSFAFFESTVGPPEVKSTSISNPSEDEVELRAEIDPNNLETDYSFEYVSEAAAQQNEEELEDPFTGATLAGEGTLAASNLDAEVSASATGLSPGTSYRFRAIATNEEGSDEAVDSFATYPSVETETEPCPNAQLRSGPSALLPDCRAYELVTPADTNAHQPLGLVALAGGSTTRQVSPAGDKIPIYVEGGALPGLGGAGSLGGDPYLSTRTPSGWSTEYTGPSPAEAPQIAPGTTSPDQGYSFWQEQTASQFTNYVRYPDGHSELVGQGSLGIDPSAFGMLISEGGGHIVFMTGAGPSATSPVQLEPDAAPSGTRAVYDRTADGITHVVSIKPDGSPFSKDAVYQGASLDGEGVAFKVDGTLYLRYRNEATFEIGTGVEFAGIAEGGSRVFYLEGGDLLRFDAEAPEGGRVSNFSTTGDVTPVPVSGDGSSAYFVSPSVLGGANPQGDSAQAGEQNLYRSVEGQIEFIATVTDRDVEGNSVGADGLGVWVRAVRGELGAIPARATPDGSVFLFKSRADLTGYDADGHAQIYRYDAVAGALQCLSCNPTGAPASADATLQSATSEGARLQPLAWPENLRADGRRAFFESDERLVARDTDGRRDVYEWEEQGVGSCTKPEGCVYLISSPNSSRNEHLWAVSESGNDVFVWSGDLLVRADADETPSIYDARVGGGFPEAQVRAECLGEACQPSVSAPGESSLASAVFSGSSNAGQRAKPRGCAKGRRKVRRAGKVRCLKRKKHHRAAAKRKGGNR